MTSSVASGAVRWACCSVERTAPGTSTGGASMSLALPKNTTRSVERRMALALSANTPELGHFGHFSGAVVR
jgi:hypothetical protein